jgi:hypothetical protein
LSQSIDHARERLASPERRSGLWITLAAAAFAAVASLVLAGMVILGPGLEDRRTTEVRQIATAR